MRRRRLSGWGPFSLCALVCAAACAIGSAACAGNTAGASADAGTSGGDGPYGGSFPPTDPSYDDGDGDAAIAPLPGTPALEAGEIDAAANDVDTDELAEAADEAPDGECPAPLGPGDLRIDELMIESVAGTGDDGEWLEIESVLDCAVNLGGLHGECPRGAKVATFDVTGDLWIPPRGTFVVADSTDPAINHDLPGTVVAWSGHQGDVLRNMGSTITVSLNGMLLDTVTYPALTLAVGASVAFPSNCDPSQRSDFSQWKRSTSSWFPGFLGTPNAPNTDVACP
jgi:hypothetical protein